MKPNTLFKRLEHLGWKGAQTAFGLSLYPDQTGYRLYHIHVDEQGIRPQDQEDFGQLEELIAFFKQRPGIGLVLHIQPQNCLGKPLPPGDKDLVSQMLGVPVPNPEAYVYQRLPSGYVYLMGRAELDLWLLPFNSIRDQILSVSIGEKALEVLGENQLPQEEQRALAAVWHARVGSDLKGEEQVEQNHQHYQHFWKRMYWMGRAMALLGLALISSLAISLCLQVWMEDEQEDLNAQSVQLEQIKTQKSLIQQQQDQLATFAEDIASGPKIGRLLDELARMMTPALRLHRIEFSADPAEYSDWKVAAHSSGPFILIRGESANAQAIAEYSSELVRAGAFRELRLVDAQLDPLTDKHVFVLIAY